MTQQATPVRKRTAGKLAKTTYVNEVVDYVDKTRPLIRTGTDDDRRGARGPRFCRVQQVGGVAGSDSTDCTFTYDIYELDNVTKININQSAVTPKGPPRDPKVEYSAATYGLYQLDYDGTWILFLINEIPATEDCAAV